MERGKDRPIGLRPLQNERFGDAFGDGGEFIALQTPARTNLPRINLKSARGYDIDRQGAGRSPLPTPLALAQVGVRPQDHANPVRPHHPLWKTSRHDAHLGDDGPVRFFCFAVTI